MNRLIPLVMVALSLACCGKAVAADSLSKLKYSCEVPEGLKKDIILHHKNSSTEKRDAHAIYKRCHSEGWHGLIAHYAKTGNTIYDPISRQEWGIMTMARNIGVSEARTQILRAELVMGEEGLRAALKETSEKNSSSEQDGAGEPATRAESESDNGDKPQPESEGRSR